MLTPPAALHALLFASGEPMEKKHIVKLLDIKESEVAMMLETLTASLKGSGVMAVETTTHVELRTVPEAAAIVKKLREGELTRDLGKASLETLAVVAYQGGATRGEVDWVRGVNSSASLRTLLMRGLVDGKEDEKDRRRIRYSLTTEALAHLGIASEKDLPRRDELRTAALAIVADEEARESSAESSESE